ncbi:MAG TPA: hypothetical protein PLY93_15340 [Turneriella sp.]|nr:hypothetical protein [Turneriella sp.]
MKRNKRSLMDAFAFALTAIFLASCTNGIDNKNNSQKFGVSFTTATFKAKNIFFQLYSTDGIDVNKNPTGTVVGWGVVSIDSANGTGTGSLRSTDGFNKLVPPGTYYLYCLADLDNGIDYQTTAWTNPIPRTSGDQYTDMLNVVVGNSETTKQVVQTDFKYAVP